MSGARRAQQVSRRSLSRERDAGASRRTVIVALAANAVIAIAKLGGGLISGSTALLAEAAHSIADTTNQAFLLRSISLAQRDPDPERPFGQGRQRFLWTFVAAVAMFVAGATFAVGYGIARLVHGGEKEGGAAIAWATLAVAFVAEGSSWLRARRQTRAEAREAGRPLKAYVRESRDPSVKMVLLEDSAALIGIAIAAVGIGLDQFTGATIWDPAASIAIGFLLIGVAAWMANDTAGLLIGASARPDEREAIERVLEEDPHITEVLELLTMVLGPSSLLVAARIDLADDARGDELEQAMNDLEERLQEAVPDVTEVFLDPTPPR